MKVLLILAVASLIGVCTCAYLREEGDFNGDAIEDRERRDATDNFDHVDDEDVNEREKRRERPGSFIMGGAQVKPHSAPMMVSVQIWGMHMCGGVLIHKRWVLTAAHCLGDPWSPSDMDVVAGAHDLRRTELKQQRSNINRWIIHSGFNAKTQDNDIALLELWPPVKLSSAVKVVSLPSSDAPDGTVCKVLGWGHNGLEPFNPGAKFHDMLTGVKLPIIAQSTCRLSDWLGSSVTANMICAGTAAGGVDTCKGDSGGPLLCKIGNKVRVYGITSHGDKCGQPKKPGVYSRITKYLTWIHQKTGGDVKTPKQ